ncbi:MAG: amidohydrolase [Parabacteroides sp.]|nr:amidohydrolase [Parabacteroides sp.]
MSILIKDVCLNGRITDVYIQGNQIKEIGTQLEVKAEQVIDGRKKAVIPGFVNAHTHAAMTLFRGFGDDMPLKAWLEEKIWPNEAKLTSEDVYWGTKLACLEMIKSGTTTFFDMYHKFSASAKAVEEMGVRALLAGACFDHFNPELREKGKQAVEKLYAESLSFSDRIRYAAGPHAIYTVSGDLLQWIHAFAEEHQVLIHLHLAETEVEVRDALRQFGLTPVRYLHKLGILSPRLILAHGLYVDDDEIRMLADHGVTVVHNPASNMKLASGYRFKYCEMQAAGVRVALGTDGCSSSNNLDMVEAMKLASLLGKAWRKDPEAVTAKEIFRTATASGAEAIGLKSGQIAEGYLADLCLVDLNIPAFAPNHDFVSNLVYAANGSCVDTVICDGKILMQDKKVPGEDEIIERASELAYKLVENPCPRD